MPRGEQQSLLEPVRPYTVLGHPTTLEPAKIMRFGGVPVTTPVRTFLFLASILRLEQLVAVANFLNWCT